MAFETGESLSPSITNPDGATGRLFWQTRDALHAMVNRLASVAGAQAFLLTGARNANGDADQAFRNFEAQLLPVAKDDQLPWTIRA
jgi:hypothetical protein